MIVSCGDALIDFVPVRADNGGPALRPVVGGSCLNVAVGLARLGVPTAFVGGLSTDLFGRMIAHHATVSGVDLGFAARSDRQTTLAFVQLLDGDTRYAFYDAQSASREWTYRPGSIPFGDVEAVHVGSTTLVDDSCAAETLALITEVRPSCTISFDPNCRPNLVVDMASYRERMLSFAAAADIIRMSDADFSYLYEGGSQDDIADALLDQGATLVVLTSKAGAKAWHRKAGMIGAEAPAVTVIDTVGAGDSFQAGLLACLRRLHLLARPGLSEAGADDLRRALGFACRCAAITCSRAGADPPASSEVTWPA